MPITVYVIYYIKDAFSMEWCWQFCGPFAGHLPRAVCNMGPVWILLKLLIPILNATGDDEIAAC